MKRFGQKPKPSRKARTTRRISAQKKAEMLMAPQGVVRAREFLATRARQAVAPPPTPMPLAVPPQAMPQLRMSWRSTFGFFAFTLASIGVAAALIRTVDAATYQGPSQAPPGGNVPVTIWNRTASGAMQTNAAIAIDGGGPSMGTWVGMQIGDETLDMGGGAGGQNLIRGLVDNGKMNAADNFIQLQTFTSPATYTTQFSVSKTGNVSAGTISGSSVTATSMTSTAWINLGSASNVITAGNNLIRGNVDTTSGGNLLNLQNENVSRFLVDAAGTTTLGGGTTPAQLRFLEPSASGVNYTAFQAQAQAANIIYNWPPTSGSSNQVLSTNGSGALNWVDVATNMCSVTRTFVGKTPATYDGDRTVGDVFGYGNADILCNSAFNGSKVCTPDEVLNSWKCQVPGDPIVNPIWDGLAWINGGPPGHTSNANDCNAWNSAAGGAGGFLGRVWQFQSFSGGRGLMSSCDLPRAFACCM